MLREALPSLAQFQMLRMKNQTSGGWDSSTCDPFQVRRPEAAWQQHLEAVSGQPFYTAVKNTQARESQDRRLLSYSSGGWEVWDQGTPEDRLSGGVASSGGKNTGSSPAKMQKGKMHSTM